eukprot:TRINITY_DN1005_c0_g2_i1.p1 TRINITY_DN1005_c0_g2~~TRINITY_DN1005_c0_g2_i1.p1  ORF type:complete len:145 (-),score=10.48 TRINITY_DN1005_c0_g2_i1:188-622(-)
MECFIAAEEVAVKAKEARGGGGQELELIRTSGIKQWMLLVHLASRIQLVHVLDDFLDPHLTYFFRKDEVPRGVIEFKSWVFARFVINLEVIVSIFILFDEPLHLRQAIQTSSTAGLKLARSDNAVRRSEGCEEEEEHRDNHEDP